MTILEQFVEEYTRMEEEKDMKWSFYFIPQWDQPEGETYAV